MRKRLERNFGEQVRCVYVEAKSEGMARFPEVERGVEEGRWRLPITLIGGAVRMHGVFSPTFIQRDLRALVGAGERPKPKYDQDRRQAALKDAFRSWAQHVSRSSGQSIRGSFMSSDRQP